MSSAFSYFIPLLMLTHLFSNASSVLNLMFLFCSYPFTWLNTEKQNPSKEMNLALGLHQPMTVEADLVAIRKCSIIYLYVLLQVSSYMNTNVEASSPATKLSRQKKF